MENIPKQTKGSDFKNALSDCWENLAVRSGHHGELRQQCGSCQGEINVLCTVHKLTKAQ